MSKSLAVASTRRSFLRASAVLGGGLAVGGIAPLGLARFLSAVDDPYQTAFLLGRSVGFVNPLGTFTYQLDRRRAVETGTTSADISFIDDVGGLVNGMWAEHSRSGVAHRAQVATLSRLHAFYRAFASWDLRVFAQLEAGKAAGVRSAGSRYGLARPMLNHCSGTDAPAPCPPWVEAPYAFQTQEGIDNFLFSFGYHRTSGYAGGDAYDFTRPVDAPSSFPSCGVPNCFRIQARTFFAGGWWGYRSQDREPNPEIFDGYYTWPEWWWGNYVQWWHLNFC